MRIVLDTNVLVSALMNAASVPGEVYYMALASHELLTSQTIRAEFEEVVQRPKLAKYVRLDAFEIVRATIASVATQLNPEPFITDCRDPKDNHLLELAVVGRADILVTGDKDLLVLHPFRGIEVLSPAMALALLEAGKV